MTSLEKKDILMRGTKLQVGVCETDLCFQLTKILFFVFLKKGPDKEYIGGSSNQTKFERSATPSCCKVA